MTEIRKDDIARIDGRLWLVDHISKTGNIGMWSLNGTSSRYRGIDTKTIHVDHFNYPVVGRVIKWKKR